MTDRKDHSGDADSRNVAICVRTLDHTIGQLASCYGATSVVAALTEVMGCSSCVADVNRGTRIRSRMEQIGLIR